MNLDVSTSLDFVRLRTEKTRAAQVAIAAVWVWPKKTLAQWDADILQLDGALEGTLAQKAKIADAQADQKRAALDLRYRTLHTVTLQAVGVMRARARGDETLQLNVDELSARGDSFRAIEEEGEELLAAWKTAFGEAFSPAPGSTYAGLKALFEGQATPPVAPALRILKRDYREARAVARREVGFFNTLVTRLEDQCVQWYGEATAVFAEGTDQGDLIREEVPTVYGGGGGPGPGGGGGGGGGGDESSSSSEDETSSSSSES